MTRPLFRLICRILVLCLATTAWTPAHAALLGAEATLPAMHTANADRARLQAMLARSDVQQQLGRLGVSVQDAQARVNAMTDDEAHLAAEKLDRLPAGGDVVGVVIGVALVLLMTDLLGFTHVYPFVHSLR